MMPIRIVPNSLNMTGELFDSNNGYKTSTKFSLISCALFSGGITRFRNVLSNANCSFVSPSGVFCLDNIPKIGNVYSNTLKKHNGKHKLSDRFNK